MADLRGKVAIVTGGSRGVGKGCALGLAEAGATVYITGRTTVEGQSPKHDGVALPGTIHQTAEEITRLGGVGIAVRCDHRNDADVAALFEQVAREQGRLDILVNNVWGGYEEMAVDGDFTWERPFWEQPLWRWEAMFAAGVRAHYVASQYAARMMVGQKSGLIVTISFVAATEYSGNTAYCVAKAADDRMISAMAHELAAHNVTAVSLYPGLVRTEGVMNNAQYFDLSNSQSPQFIGRGVAALATDPDIMRKSGQIYGAAQLGLAYGFTDIDAKQPQP